MSHKNSDVDYTRKIINPASRGPWAGHPLGLIYLLFTEFWERFAYAIVQGLLVIYVVQHFSWSDDKSYALTGAYTALVYISPLLGGYLADNFIGQSRALVVGGVFLIIGYSLMVLGTEAMMFLGLGCVIMGNGLYKPNVSAMVGNLYHKESIKREEGYTLFFVGFNVGIFISTVSIGFIKDYIGWNYIFLLASIAIIIGLFIFLYGRRYVIDSFDITHPSDSIKRRNMPWARLFCLFIGAIFIIIGLLYYSDIANLLFILLGVGLGSYMIWLIIQYSGEQAQKLGLLLVLMCVAILFWGLYFEEFSVVNLYLDRVVDRVVFDYELPPIFFISCEPFFVVSVGLWFSGFLHKSNFLQISMLNKFMLALVSMFIAFSTLILSAYFPNQQGQVQPYNMIPFYFFVTLGQLFLYPIGMAAVLKLSPRKMHSFMMGAWFFTLGIGGALSGLLGKLAKIDSNQLGSVSIERVIYQHAFMYYALIALGGVVLVIILRPLARRYLGKIIDL